MSISNDGASATIARPKGPHPLRLLRSSAYEKRSVNHECYQHCGHHHQVCDHVQSILSKHGNLLMAAGASLELSSLVADLHTHTWISVAKDTITDASPVVHTMKGARQGCKIGALILKMITQKLILNRRFIFRLDLNLES